MFDSLLVFLFAAALAVATVFLYRRLGLNGGLLTGTKYAYWSGSALLLLATIWQGIKFIPDYADWFIITAYPVISTIQVIVLLAGLFLVTRALAVFYAVQTDKRSEIDFREQKLNILENLQKVAREPYQFLELLNLSMKEIVSILPESAGAVFLVGRSRQQFILASSIGLTSEETARLEYFPLDDNIVSQALESAEPLISRHLDFVSPQDETAKSRFSSVLVLPLVSGTERIGGIILFSEKERQFGSSEIRVLSPVAEWLAEKIKSARLTRELAALRKGIEEQELKLNDVGRRLTVLASLDSGDLLNAFCTGLKGFADSDSVHLVSVINGSFDVLAGSEPLVNISDSYIDTLIDALQRNRPIVINQEADDEEGRTFTTVSTLVYPLGKPKQGYAILLRRESEPYALENSQLRLMGLFSRLAVFALEKQEYTEADSRRRRALDKIVQMLRLPARLTFRDDPGFFVRHLLPLFPVRTRGMSFVSNELGGLECAELFGFESALSGSLTLPAGAGFIGKTFDGKPRTIKSSEDFVRALGEFADDVRREMERLFDNASLPGYVLACPVMKLEKLEGVVVFFFDKVSDIEQKEYEQFITLAAGLYSLSITVTSLNLRQPQSMTAGAAPEQFGEMVNTINNYLATVIGNAEILMTRTGLDNEVRSQVQSILYQAEIASDYVSALVRESRGTASGEQNSHEDEYSLDDIARQALKNSHVSENLYMLAGRAREIELKLGDAGFVNLVTADLTKLFADALNHFASLADDEDIITVATYEREGYVYLDVSRHRRNFPPVESVAGFGSYQMPEDVIQNRPKDDYLENAFGKDCLFAYDRFSTAPSYISFKFPARQVQPVTRTKENARVQILAVDDQPVILELISAMCQSLGYDVTTAGSGAEALRLFKERQFDVILTDLAMPEMSGLELARQIRRSCPDIPIILVTGWEVTIDKEQLEEVGISDVLYKPFRIEQLTSLVKLAATGQSA